ncbi:DUF6146 family protein [Chryseobacterium sp. MP_3.2]|uniref:DUF6146 family protein n=1 Tax=Chryseobacterium sp. MP_3.2 TaxID=3071712 RepID=UPI002E0B92E8|nr:hypothetical protein [Chryseobacterium sp. MP_3.2]
MKKLLAVIIVSLVIISCVPQNNTATNQGKSEIKPEKNAEDEWELTVIDSQFDYFVNAVAKPKSMYSESYLKSKNSFLVTEWNGLYISGRHRNVIESSIDYDRQENYGFDFEYKLYQVFAFVQWKYGLRLQGLSQSDVR